MRIVFFGSFYYEIALGLKINMGKQVSVALGLEINMLMLYHNLLSSIVLKMGWNIV